MTPTGADGLRRCWNDLKWRWRIWNPRWSILGPIAEFLNNRWPEKYCWSELVMWGMFRNSSTLEDARRRVRKCAKEIGSPPYSCYCGKFMDAGLRQQAEAGKEDGDGE